MATLFSNLVSREVWRHRAALNVYNWACAWSYIAATLPAEAPKDALDDYEKQLQNYFRHGIQGGMGEDHNCDKDMKRRNRMARRVSRIICEAGPRHSEIMFKSLNLLDAVCLTPGDKKGAIKQGDRPQRDVHAKFLDVPGGDNDDNETDEHNLINSLRARCVHNSDKPQTTMHSETYSRHPRKCVLTSVARRSFYLLAPSLSLGNRSACSRHETHMFGLSRVSKQHKQQDHMYGNITLSTAQLGNNVWCVL